MHWARWSGQRRAESECSSSKNGGSPKHCYPNFPYDLLPWPECYKLCYECSLFQQCIKITCCHKRDERILKVCTALIGNINKFPHAYNLLRLWCSYLYWCSEIRFFYALYRCNFLICGVYILWQSSYFTNIINVTVCHEITMYCVLFL